MERIAALNEQWKGTFAEMLGVQFIRTEPESVSAHLTVRPDLCTLGGVLHGGAVMAFADTLGAVATLLNLPEGAHTTTIESKTNFISGAPVNTRVTAETTPLHRGRRTMVWQTQIKSETGKLVAIVMQTQLVLT